MNWGAINREKKELKKKVFAGKRGAKKGGKGKRIASGERARSPDHRSKAPNN